MFIPGETTLTELQAELDKTDRLLGSGVRGSEYKTTLSYKNSLEFLISSSRENNSEGVKVRQLEHKIKEQQTELQSAMRERNEARLKAGTYRSQLLERNAEVKQLRQIKKQALSLIPKEE